MAGATYYVNYTGDADIVGTVAVTFVGDSSILEVIASTLTGNAAVVTGYNDTLTGDSNLLKAISSSLTSDANIVGSILPAPTYTGDAKLSGSIAASLTADACILAIVSSSFTGDSFITSLFPMADLVEVRDNRDMGAKKSIARVKVVGTILNTFRSVEGAFHINMAAMQLSLSIPSLGGETLTAALLDAQNVTVWSKSGITQSQDITYQLPTLSDFAGNTGVYLVGNNVLRFTTSADMTADTLITALVYGQ